MTDIRDLISQYENSRTAYDLESAEYARVRDEIMSKVQDELDAAGAEFAPRLATCSEGFTALEKQIRMAVLLNGKTEKGSRWQFVFSHGRVKWDEDRLDKLSATVPEIAECKSVGDPVISVKEIKPKKEK